MGDSVSFDVEVARLNAEFYAVYEGLTGRRVSLENAFADVMDMLSIIHKRLALLESLSVKKGYNVRWKE